MQVALTKPQDESSLEPSSSSSSSSNHSFPHINEGKRSLQGSEKCNKKPFCECSHLWNFKRTSCKQERREQILSHSSNALLLPRICLSSLFSSISSQLCFSFNLRIISAFFLSPSLCGCLLHCNTVALLFLSSEHLADANTLLLSAISYLFGPK